MHEIELWTGIRHKIPLCCIIFYESVWRLSIKNQIPEYSETMAKLTKNQGTILCPDCISDLMSNLGKMTIRRNRRISQRNG